MSSDKPLGFHIYGFIQSNSLAEIDRIGFIIPILQMIKLNLLEVPSNKDKITENGPFHIYVCHVEFHANDTVDIDFYVK